MTLLRPEVFQYLDYRAFLKDLLAYERSQDKRMSLRAFSARIMPALSSSGLLSGVLKGKKNLGPAMRIKFVKALRLNAREAKFFDLLIQFNQMSDLAEKNQLFSQLSRFGKSRAKLLSQGQYLFFRKWYYPVVWNYFGINKNEKNLSKIASAIYPPLTTSQVEEAIRLLLELGLIKKMANGYAVTENHLTTEPEFRGMDAAQYNQQFLDLATHALHGVDARHRQFSTMVFSVSRSTVELLKEKMAAFQEEAQEIIDNDPHSECIYTLGVHLYPNSGIPAAVNGG